MNLHSAYNLWYTANANPQGWPSMGFQCCGTPRIRCRHHWHPFGVRCHSTPSRVALCIPILLSYANDLRTAAHGCQQPTRVRRKSADVPVEIYPLDATTPEILSSVESYEWLSQQHTTILILHMFFFINIIVKYCFVDRSLTFFPISFTIKYENNEKNVTSRDIVFLSFASAIYVYIEIYKFRNIY